MHDISPLNCYPKHFDQKEKRVLQQQKVCQYGLKLNLGFKIPNPGSKFIRILKISFVSFLFHRDPPAVIKMNLIFSL